MKVIRLYGYGDEKTEPDRYDAVCTDPLDAKTWEDVGKIVLSLGRIPEVAVIGWCCDSETCMSEVAKVTLKLIARKHKDVAVLTAVGAGRAHDPIRIPGVVFVDGRMSHDKKV